MRRDQSHIRRGTATAVIGAMAVAVVALLVACSVGSAAVPDGRAAATRAQDPATPPPTGPPSPTSAAEDSRVQATGSPSEAAPVGPDDPGAPPTRPSASDGRPQPAVLGIPSIGVRGLSVQPYLGQTDDRVGTVLQNRGLAASPFGPAGGVGPGGIGNYQITAHRNTAGGPLFHLPRVALGDKVEVMTAERRYVYEITQTRRTSFRSPRSLQEQRAAVPGHSGATPRQAMITISTCLTQEDHAAGNYWHDEFDNPEHRIDKIGVLVESTLR